MRKHPLKLISVFALTLLTMFCVPPRAAADDDDPPTRVARLSHVDGSVSFEPGGTDEWVTAGVNRPMTTGDKLWADHDSRAELHIGSASIRLGASTGFSFLNLNDNTVQLQITEGTLRIRVRRLDRDDNFEVDTPNLAFSILRPGVYRVSVNEAGDTTVVNVRDGEGQVTGGGESYSVHANETGTFTGTDQLYADIVGLGNDDDLERWSEERDRRDDHATARRYVSDDVVGYEDLDEYGGWRDVPEYGTVWFPRTTVAGWAPYRYGHWVYIQPWGYTWVDDEPWGFAPFHYGRWIAVGGVWGWVPCRPRAVVGVAYVRPVYAPALVAWIGGPHFAVGVAVGGASSVGWFPLGPREVYVPSYRVSRTYVNNVNISNTTVNTTVVNNYYNTNVVNNNTTVTNVRYVNQGVPGAVTATSTQVLATSQPVARNAVRADERQMASAQVAVRAPAMAPERQAFVGAERAASARPPERIENRAVVARTAPPPPPASVERQQVAIRQNGGQPLAISQARQIEPQQKTVAAPVRMAPPARPAQPQNDAGNRPGQPQNNVRPGREGGNAAQNGPQNNRPNTPPPNAEQPANVQPNRPAVNSQPAAPAANNDRSNNQRNDRPASARPDNNRPDQPQNNVRPGREGGNAAQNGPQNNRPNTPPPNAEQPANVQPNRPAVNNQPAAPAANNERPNNQRNDRPASARPDTNRPDTQPANAQPNRAPANDRSNTPPPNTQPNRPPANDRPANEQQGRQQPPPRQQPQEVQQQQQRPAQVERQQPPPRQQPQEVQQQQQRPAQAQRQQPPPRQQQEKPKQQDKPKEKEKDKPPKG
jgi:FecR protein